MVMSRRERTEVWHMVNVMRFGRISKPHFFNIKTVDAHCLCILYQIKTE